MTHKFAVSFGMLVLVSAIATSAFGQYEQFPLGEYETLPPANGGYFPTNNAPPPNDSSMPTEYQIGNAPGDRPTYRLPPANEPSYGPTPRNSSFLPERAASYAPENQRPYDRPTQEFGGPGNAPWGPAPDIYSIAPEGARGPARPPQAEPAPPLNTIPVNQGPPNAAQDQPENEFFDPNPADLNDGVIWYQPSTWEDFGWDATVELGLNGSAGNSRTNALKAGFKAERETEIYKFLFEIVHNRASAEDVSTQNNVISRLRLDRKLHESRWNLFAQGYSEYDEFKDFDLRLVGNLGINYKFIKTETTTLSGDLGSGVSHEIGGPDDRYTPEAILGLDFKHKLSKRQQLYVKSDYFPDWRNFNSYRVVTDAGWELLLDEEWGLNLKIGVIDRYDSTPGSRKPNDLNYSMLLLWKL